MANPPSASPSARDAQLSSLSYEQAMEELESIVAAMDNDRLPLEDMILRYDRGTQLLKVCQSRLQAAQQRVELIQAGKTGATLAPLDGSAETQTETSPTAADAAPTAPAKSRRPAPKALESDDDNEIRLF